MDNYTNNTRSNYKNIVAGLALAGALALSGCGRDKRSYDPTPRDDTQTTVRAPAEETTLEQRLAAKGHKSVHQTVEGRVIKSFVQEHTIPETVIFAKKDATRYMTVKTDDGKLYSLEQKVEGDAVPYTRGTRIKATVFDDKYVRALEIIEPVKK